MEVANKKEEETFILGKSIFFVTKYLLSLIIGVLLLLGEGILKRIQFMHYERLRLWEGKIILLPNHRGWLDVILATYIYFPWWYRELRADIIDLLGEFRVFFWRLIRWIFDERVKIKIGSGDKIFSRDVPITAADKHNLRNFPWLFGFILKINREKFGGKPNERAASTRFAMRVLKNNGRVIDFAEGGMINSVGDEEKIFDIATRKPILRLLETNFCALVSITGARVQPVIFLGTDRVLPRGKFPFPRIWHRITINIGELLSFPIGTPPETVESIINKARIDLYYETVRERK